MKLKGVSLSCQSGLCRCPAGSTWFWSTYSSQCVSCPAGWTVYIDRCYYYTTATDTWSGAQSQCQSAGGYLIIVNDQSEYDRLVAFYQSSGAPALWVSFSFCLCCE